MLYLSFLLARPMSLRKCKTSLLIFIINCPFFIFSSLIYLFIAQHAMPLIVNDASRNSTKAKCNLWDLVYILPIYHQRPLSIIKNAPNKNGRPHIDFDLKYKLPNCFLSLIGYKRNIQFHIRRHMKNDIQTTYS